LPGLLEAELFAFVSVFSTFGGLAFLFECKKCYSFPVGGLFLNFLLELVTDPSSSELSLLFPLDLNLDS
jgi:hypothetical protein